MFSESTPATHFFRKVPPPNPSRTAMLAGDQVLTCSSLWKTLFIETTAHAIGICWIKTEDSVLHLKMHHKPPSLPELNKISIRRHYLNADKPRVEKIKQKALDIHVQTCIQMENQWESLLRSLRFQKWDHWRTYLIWSPLILNSQWSIPPSHTTVSRHNRSGLIGLLGVGLLIIWVEQAEQGQKKKRKWNMLP